MSYIIDMAQLPLSKAQVPGSSRGPVALLDLTYEDLKPLEALWCVSFLLLSISAPAEALTICMRGVCPYACVLGGGVDRVVRVR